MSYDANVQRRAVERLERERRERRERTERLRQEVYQKEPRLEQLDRRLQGTMAGLVAADDHRSILLTVEAVLNVEIEGFAESPGSFVRSRTAMRFAVLGTAAMKWRAEKGR